MLRLIHFHRSNPTRTQSGAAWCAVFVLLALAALHVTRLSHAAGHKRQQLTLEDRIAAQRAIETVYHRHRLWPKENPQPKPPLEQVMPDEAIRATVEEYLRQSAVLETFWQRQITAEQLQAELERQA